ncbi:hypothetical protein IP69_12965 [Bosea sp. AAP35]|uniref:hypothetical protein n=1 Tax=Bosea sp. AAP35 TaxID=1523417 RepID=UPI0006B8EB7A|nr:hypothetical protein [Bosea sp. AAP35]KPF67611.1 hypothetical protein IP69_12965 [Bosea sp. AAP35]
MLKLVLGQALGAYLTKLAASGRYPRAVSAVLALAATRMGGASRVIGIWGLISALTGRRGR